MKKTTLYCSVAGCKMSRSLQCLITVLRHCNLEITCEVIQVRIHLFRSCPLPRSLPSESEQNKKRQSLSFPPEDNYLSSYFPL